MSADPIRVVLAVDHALIRKGLREFFTESSDIDVIAEASNGDEAIRVYLDKRPDVVLMDITMPVLNGLEATRQIKSLHPQIKVVVLTVHSTQEYVFQILQAGGSGYVLKQAAVSELIQAIRAASGSTPVPRK